MEIQVPTSRHNNACFQQTEILSPLSILFQFLLFSEEAEGSPPAGSNLILHVRPNKRQRQAAACWRASAFLFPEITVTRYNMQGQVSAFCCPRLHTTLWLTASTTAQSEHNSDIPDTFPVCCYHKCVNTSCSSVRRESIWFPKRIRVCPRLLFIPPPIPLNLQGFAW